MVVKFGKAWLSQTCNFAFGPGENGLVLSLLVSAVGVFGWKVKVVAVWAAWSLGPADRCGSEFPIN